MVSDPKRAIERRRAAASRVGLLGLGIVTIVLGATACIFDQSTYQGGGRLGRAATAQQENLGPGEDEEEDDESSSSSSSSGSTTPDAGLD